MHAHTQFSFHEHSGCYQKGYDINSCGWGRIGSTNLHNARCHYNDKFPVRPASTPQGLLLETHMHTKLLLWESDECRSDIQDDWKQILGFLQQEQSEPNRGDTVFQLQHGRKHGLRCTAFCCGTAAQWGSLVCLWCCTFYHVYNPNRVK